MIWRNKVGELGRDRRFRPSSIAILTGSFALGLALFSTGSTPRTLLAIAVGTVTLGILLLYPELALALYVVVGDVKGDDRVAALVPVDLTLVLGAALLAGMALNLLRRKRAVPMPPAYFLFLALVLLMTASLTYTTVLAAGIEKLGRFLTVTGIVIVAPFVVLSTPQAMKRFFAGFGVAAFAICAWSLSSLGGSERLATPSDNTIGLGHIACAVILLIWFAVIPRCAFPRRMIAYLLLGVPVVALIGSGSRGAAIACAVVILVSPLFRRRLMLDLTCLTGLGLVALPFARIPASSFEYLGTLAADRGLGALLSFRADLLIYGWKLLTLHPLMGVGIQGFRYYSPNPELYKWPHNIFLEIGCEMGIPAALIALAIFGSATREAYRQLRDRDSPYFVLSQLAAALLVVGVINGTNTGDINSDRATWLFVSLVFVVRGLRIGSQERLEAAAESRPLAAY
jgi:O-antigen ligase